MSQTLLVTPADERQRLAHKGRAAIARDAWRERQSLRKERQKAAFHAKPTDGVAKRIKDFPYQILSMGRKFGKPLGSHIDDLVALRQTVLLCDNHRSGFDYRSHHYFYEKKLRVGGDCDACRDVIMDAKGHLFIHESYLGTTGTWVPR